MFSPVEGLGQRLALPYCLPFAFCLSPAGLMVETREAATCLEGETGSLGISPADPLGAGATRGHPLVAQSPGTGTGGCSIPPTAATPGAARVCFPGMAPGSEKQHTRKAASDTRGLSNCSRAWVLAGLHDWGGRCCILGRLAPGLQALQVGEVLWGQQGGFFCPERRLLQWNCS